MHKTSFVHDKSVPSGILEDFGRKGAFSVHPIPHRHLPRVRGDQGVTIVRNLQRLCNHEGGSEGEEEIIAATKAVYIKHLACGIETRETYQRKTVIHFA